MEVNFDLLVSGCHTRCRHCYVRGGPGPHMPLMDVVDCILALDRLAAALPWPCSFTLDNEPMGHPGIEEILEAASCTRHVRYYHHGMTTGIGLMARGDRERVMRAYLDRGWRDMGVTLHGAEERHDGIVRRAGAHRAALEAARFMKSCGAEVNVSLMLNRYFPEDAERIDRILAQLAPSFIYFAIPNYTPHCRMMDFESCRADMGALRQIASHLTAWGQEAENLIRRAEEGTIRALRERLGAGLRLRELFREPQGEMYLTVRGDCRLYMGNTGAETACLGDVRETDAERTAEIILRSPGNRDYGAFYDPESLPGEEELASALDRLNGDLLYSDMASAMYRGLAEMGVPTRILSL